MRWIVSFSAVVVLILSASCSEPEPTFNVPTERPTATAIIVPTFTPIEEPTETPTLIPTITPTNTASPTPTLYVLEGTTLPPPVAPILVENASDVSALATWHEPTVVDMTWTPDGRFLAVANQETINLYDIQTRQIVRTLYPSTKDLVQIAFSPNGKWFISGSRRGSLEEGFFSTIEIWYGPDWKPLGILYDVPRALSRLEFSLDSEKLAMAFTSHVYEENLIEFLSTINWQIIDQLKPGPVLDIAFSLDGSQIAISPDRYAINMWDFNEEEWIETIFTSFTGAVTRMSYSPDGITFGSARYDGTIRLWDMEIGEQLLIINSEEVIEDLDFSPDGRLIASGGSYQNAYVRLWDASTGALLRTLAGHMDGVIQILFSPSGYYLISASYDGQLILWGLRQ